MIAQIGTFTTYGLRDQVGGIPCHKDGWVKLHKFQVGQCCTGTPRQGQPICSCPTWIRGVQPETTSTTTRHMCIVAWLRTIKLYTHLHEPPHGSRSLLYQDTHSCFVAESRTGSYGILEM